MFNYFEIPESRMDDISIGEFKGLIDSAFADEEEITDKERVKIDWLCDVGALKLLSKTLDNYVQDNEHVEFNSKLMDLELNFLTYLSTKPKESIGLIFTFGILYSIIG